MAVPKRAVALAAVLGGLVMIAASGGVLAANPASVTVSPGGPSQSWTGSVLGQGDESNGFGLLAPSPLPQCTAPGCDDETVNLVAPGAAAGSLTLSVTLAYAENGNTATNDFFILDANRNVLASNGTAYAPSLTITAAGLSAGIYTVEVDGDGTVADNNNNAPVPYTASAKAGRVNLPALPSSLGFAPATVVSPTFLGAEPQVAMERPNASAVGGALSKNRLYIDWPLGSTINIGQLSRSTDGGDSFRLLFDPNCAFRSRPMCTTGGGGDTVNRVNQYDGTLYFADQESLANEAFAASHNHGDSFPITSSDPAGSYGTDVDRQWLGTVDAPPATYTLAGGAEQIRGFLSFHQPAADATIEGIDQNDLVIPQPVPQAPLVGQSGPLRVDSVRGYVYLPYRDTQAASFHLGVAPISGYNDPTQWHNMAIISANATPNSFPWISLDTAGNLYATWTNGDGPTWYSYSLFTDPANNPAVGGVPGSKWSTPVKISVPALGSTYFPAVVAGDPGRVAIAYMGTPDFSGPPPNAPATARWYTFVAESTNALSASPTWLTGTVSHHPDHTGGICTSGTACAAMPGPAGDRSLLDMIYVDVDSDGRPGVVFMNNDNQEARDTGSMGQLGDPFVKFAKMTSGPSLFSGHAGISLSTPHGSVNSPAGNAIWPTTAAGANLPALDEVHTALYPDGKGDIVGRIDLADASDSSAAAALNALNAQPEGGLPYARLQYVLRWETPGTKPDGTDDQVGYLAMDVDGSGNRTFYGGVLNGNAALLNPLEATAKRASGYPATSIHVEGKVSGSTIYLIGTSNDLQTGPKQAVYSVTGFALAGPSAANETLTSPMRVVDATAPFDGMGTFQANPIASNTNPFTAGAGVLTAGSLLGGGLAAVGVLLLVIGAATARLTFTRKRR